ncbi:CBS domain-containing protein [Actinomycetospora chibensis]|uniref:CBS domain-containing protein n=1 Tax=Actinomycetospora chibensis TaxID=663606 RepID=UPI0023659C19|nr:CBS domain-containing protein [Actinomycetospora chibensis]MDD7922203.1 CBS domain-containing protein [Actinomycetospora chibensis]MDD7922227.1 CBS domain-containing protein [Actinomycetospora chibensis]
MKVRDIMSHPVIRIGPDTPVTDAAALLVEHGISALPVVDDTQRLIGILSEADLVAGRIPAHGDQQPPPTTSRAGQLMTDSPITREPDSDVADVVHTMLDHRLRAIPIVDHGTLVGIISRRDVLRCVAQGELTSADVWRHRFGLVDQDRG